MLNFNDAIPARTIAPIFFDVNENLTVSIPTGSIIIVDEEEETGCWQGYHFFIESGEYSLDSIMVS